MDSCSCQKVNVDLHMHTTCSDGTDSPGEIVKLAASKNLKVISITDHDTVSGVQKAVEVAKREGIEFIPGIEVTADTSFLPSDAEFHILGYFIDIESSAIKELVEFFSKTREKRNRLLIERLEDAGYDIHYEDVESLFGKNFGKPNIVTLLVEKKIVPTRKEAFSLIKKYRVKREKLDYREIFRLLKEANGIPVVAHPPTLKIPRNYYLSFFTKLKEEGLEGVEIIHSIHTPADVEALKGVVKELSLLSTGGSDYHGYNKPDIALGMLNIKLEDLNFGIFTGV
ncbi:PHP domain-containing protein [Desulfurobacterium atlanticum]|uniref:Polymerase/histidinol phosphatase N-terminal domain-containing protein n=1 Tax=Desulfurobacterium atlanticum TaxID=240169 RepID=A0A238XNQ4_9BACT|nr:PHP domain-containing protein [Desulfurobacterium atlanticum]SNR60171.1 hypothetical protein SAMN06265340_101112 [Desulfurobacterium atlanticum]